MKRKRKKKKAALVKVVHTSWALKPRPKGAKKSTGKADSPLSARIVTNFELRRLGAWRVPQDDDERTGGLPVGMRS